MSLILNGTDGLSDVDGTAATPAIRGTDANTGIFFPAADTIAFSEGGVESMRIDGSGNVGIGTTSPASLGKLVISQASSGTAVLAFESQGSWNSSIKTDTQNLIFSNPAATERMRIDASGNLLVGTTTAVDTSGLTISSPSLNGCFSSSTTASATNHYRFYNPNGVVGTISTSGSATTYSTSSDYRLKENIAPMTGALATVSALKPVTYNWKADGSSSQGFIAHELQEIMPDCVAGEKDAVDEDGNIKPQGIDTSFLVATLTAAIQELKATVDAQAARIAALESAGA
jgi:hypothetical protein